MPRDWPVPPECRWRTPHAERREDHARTCVNEKEGDAKPRDVGYHQLSRRAREPRRLLDNRRKERDGSPLHPFTPSPLSTGTAAAEEPCRRAQSSHDSASHDNLKTPAGERACMKLRLAEYRPLEPGRVEQTCIKRNRIVSDPPESPPIYRRGRTEPFRGTFSTRRTNLCSCHAANFFAGHPGRA